MSIFTNIAERLKKSPLVSREALSGLLKKELPKPEEPKPQSETLKRGTQIAKGILEIPKAVVQGMFRSGASVGLTLTGKDQLLIDEGVSKLEKTIQSAMFGKEPVKSLETRIAEGELGVKKFAQEKGIKPLEKAALPTAFLGIMGLTALDFTTGGGKSTIIKSLTRLNKVDDVAKVLKEIGTADDLIKSYAPILAKTTKAEEVGKIVNRLEELQKTTKITPKVLPEKLIKPIPKELEPLATEARKYKSAEEFVNKLKILKEEVKTGRTWDSGIKALPKEDRFLAEVAMGEKYQPEISSVFGKQYGYGDEAIKNFYTQATKGVRPLTGQVSDFSTGTGYFIRLSDGRIERGFPTQRDAQIALQKLLKGEEIPYTATKGIKEIPELKEYVGKASERIKWKIDRLENKIFKQPIALRGITDTEFVSIQKGGIPGDWFSEDLTEALGYGYRRAKSLNESPYLLIAKKSADVSKQIGKAEDILGITDIEGNLLWKAKGIKEVKAEVAKGFKWQERGFIKSIKEELPELKVAGQYVPKTNDRLMMKAANLIKDDLATAEKMALTGIDDNAVAVGAKLLDNYADDIAKTTNKSIKNALEDKSAELANTMARNLTESGRSVQAAALLGRLTPEGQLRFAAREIQKYNEAIEKTKGGLAGLKKKIPELTSEQAGKIIDEMNAIKKMADGTEKAMRFQKLQNYIQDLVPSSLMSKIIAVWKAGLLTGIKTSGLNIFSNISHFGSEIIKDVPAKAVDSVASLFTGKKTIGLTVRGTISGIKEGFGKGIRYLKTGFDERNIGIKLDWKRVNFGKGKIAKGLQKYEETIFRIMGTEDQPFYYGAKARSLYDQAIAQASNKGLRGIEKQKLINSLVESPTEDMLKYAIKDAETAVYQQQTLLGKAARQIQKIPGGEFVVPFGRTPSAVATQIINYSPVGIVKTIVQNIGKGKFDQRLFAQGLGRGITGTGALYVGYELGKKGLIALDRPTGEREQKLWELEGRKPNSIKIGGKWQSPIVLGPAGNLLLVGAHFQKAFQDSGSPTEALAKGTLSSAKSFSEQTFLTGINQLTNALTDPEKFTTSYPSSLLSSTIPTIVGDVAKAIDPKERRTSEILDRLKAKIPILRETLEPQITVLGEERERVGNVLEVMIDPMRPQKEITTPLIFEFRRLANAGFKVSPTLLGDKKGYDGLTSEQNTELWKRAGEITESKLNNLIKLDEYVKSTDDKRAKVIESITDKSKLVARTEMVIKLTNGLTGEGLKNKLSELKKSGLMTREVFETYLKLR